MHSDGFLDVGRQVLPGNHLVPQVKYTRKNIYYEGNPAAFDPRGVVTTRAVQTKLVHDGRGNPPDQTHRTDRLTNPLRVERCSVAELDGYQRPGGVPP